MKLTVLVDNNTFIDQYYLGEPALSFYIEDDGRKVLFDTAYSDIFMKNARALGIDLAQPMDIVISHGHNDHTGGLQYMKQEGILLNKRIIAHPLAFERKEYGCGDIGSPLSKSELEKITELLLRKEPCDITEKLVFLGEIPDIFEWESRKSIGKTVIGEQKTGDKVRDDSAVVYRGTDGLFIITGCSHSGICNIIEYAKQVCHQDKVEGVIGGFHLFDTDERLDRTIEYFKENNIKILSPCHCVSFAAKARIHQSIPINEIGVSYTMTLS